MLLGKIKSDNFKNKKGGGTRGFVPLLLDRTSAQISLNIWSYFCSLKCKIVNNKKNFLASLANFTILLFSKFS